MQRPKRLGRRGTGADAQVQNQLGRLEDHRLDRVAPLVHRVQQPGDVGDAELLDVAAGGERFVAPAFRIWQRHRGQPVVIRAIDQAVLRLADADVLRGQFVDALLLLVAGQQQPVAGARVSADPAVEIIDRAARLHHLACGDGVGHAVGIERRGAVGRFRGGVGPERQAVLVHAAVRRQHAGKRDHREGFSAGRAIHDHQAVLLDHVREREIAIPAVERSAGRAAAGTDDQAGAAQQELLQIEGGVAQHDQIAIGPGGLDHRLQFAAVSVGKALVEGLGGGEDDRRDLVEALLLEKVLEMGDQRQRRLQRQRPDLPADLLRRPDGRQNRQAVDVTQLALAVASFGKAERFGGRSRSGAETEDCEAEEMQA